MKNYWCTSLLLFVASIQLAFAQDVEWLVMPKKNTPDALIEKLKNHPDILKSEDIFDSGEARYFKESTQNPELALTFKIYIPSQLALENIKTWSAQHGDWFDFEENDSITLDSEDPLSNEQWALNNTGKKFTLKTSDIEGVAFQGIPGEDVGILKAPAENPNRTILVAVLDTGIDTKHPDLKDQLYSNTSECEAVKAFENCIVKERNRPACEQKWASVDTDGNGYALDCHGWNILGLVDKKTGVRGNNEVADDIGHGTHVSGIIAAAQNGYGVQGVAKNVRIMPIKILRESVPEPARPLADDTETPTTPVEQKLPKVVSFADLFSRGFLYALRNKAQVINMSLAWPRNADSIFMRKLVKLAIDQGVVVVASAGNDSSPNPVYPCLYDGVVCVAAHGPDGALSKFSNYGSGVDIAAPGFMILSTWLTECDDPNRCRQIYYNEHLGFDFRSGTSMASPYIAGLFARLLNAGFSADESYARLMIGSRPILRSEIDPNAQKKWIRNGNADLARSFAVEARPWIAPVKKETLFMSWDRKSSRVQFSLELKNYWASAQNVSVELSLDPAFTQRGIHLAQERLEYGAIPSGAISKTTGALLLDHTGIPSEIILRATPVVDGVRQPELQIQTEIIVLVSGALNDGVVQHLMVAPSDALRIKNAEIRSIQLLDGNDSNPEYIAIIKSPQFWDIFLLKTDGISDYRILANGRISSQLGSILKIQKAETGYLFSFKIQETRDGKRVTAMKWLSLNPSLQPLSEPRAYEGTLGPLPEINFWVKKGQQRLPLWINAAQLPADELPAATPWKKAPENTASRRIYFLDGTGVHTIKTPESYDPVDVLSQVNPEGMAFLLASGKEFDREFYVAILTPEFTWKSVQKLSMDLYHMIGGITPTPINSLSFEQRGRQIGLAFGSPSVLGSNRISWLTDTRVLQRSISPAEGLSSIHRIAAFFTTGQNDHTQVFGQTMYNIEFRDLTDGSQATTTIKRYGFMAKNIFDQFYKPLVVSQSDGSLAGALYFQSGQGVSLSSEIILKAGGSLERPAKFRLLPSGGCTDLDPSAQHLMYYCGDRFIRVPLEFDFIK